MAGSTAQRSAAGFQNQIHRVVKSGASTEVPVGRNPTFFPGAQKNIRDLSRSLSSWFFQGLTVLAIALPALNIASKFYAADGLVASYLRWGTILSKKFLLICLESRIYSVLCAMFGFLECTYLPG